MFRAAEWEFRLFFLVKSNALTRAEAGFPSGDVVNTGDVKVSCLVQKQYRVLVILRFHHCALHPHYRHR